MSVIERILNNKTTIEIENSIAKQIGCFLYRDNLPLMIGFIKEEVEASLLSFDQIEDFINENKEKIIAFGVNFLLRSKPESLSVGIAIKFTIYLIYLEEKEEIELCKYLRKRRIPQPEKLLKRLQGVKYY